MYVKKLILENEQSFQMGNTVSPLLQVGTPQPWHMVDLGRAQYLGVSHNEGQAATAQRCTRNLYMKQLAEHL
jgi:hypothetical protein